MRVEHDHEGSRFVARLDEGEAELSYRERGPVLDLIHTVVPPSGRGRGVGERLVEAAFDHARGRDLAVVATCPFVKAWVRAHPEVRDLMHGAGSG